MLAGRCMRPPFCKALSLCGRFVHWCACEIAHYIPPRVRPMLLCVSPWAVDVYICQWDHRAAVCRQILTGPSDVKSFSVAQSGKKKLHTSRNWSVQLFSGNANSFKNGGHWIQLFSDSNVRFTVGGHSHHAEVSKCCTKKKSVTRRANEPRRQLFVRPHHARAVHDCQTLHEAPLPQIPWLTKVNFRMTRKRTLVL